MSSIASFYVFDESAIPTLKKKAGLPVGKKWGIAGKWVDPFWDYTFSNARELEKFDRSGFAFAHLFTFLDGMAISIRMDEFVDRELTHHLCKTHGDTFFVFQSAGAKRLDALLGSITCDLPTASAFLRSEDPDFSPEAIVDAYRHLRQWLGEIASNEYGMLSVG